jgi:hypothetical protein
MATSLSGESKAPRSALRDDDDKSRFTTRHGIRCRGRRRWWLAADFNVSCLPFFSIVLTWASSNFYSVRVIRTPRPRAIRFAGIVAPPCPCLRRRSSMTTASTRARDVACQRKVGCNVDKEGRTRRQRARSIRGTYESMTMVYRRTDARIVSVCTAA